MSYNKKKNIIGQLNEIIHLTKISIDGHNAKRESSNRFTSYIIPVGLKQQTQHMEDILEKLQTLRVDIENYGKVNQGEK